MDGFKERMVKLLEEGEEEALFQRRLPQSGAMHRVRTKNQKSHGLESIDVEKYQEMCDKYEFRSLRNRMQTMRGEEFVTKEEEAEVGFDALEELRVMVHLLHSEMTNADVSDIQNVTGKRTAEEMKERLEADLKKEGLWDLFTDVEQPLIPRIRDMEANGITLDVKKLAVLSEHLHIEVKKLEKDIYALAGMEFNIGSPKAIKRCLL
jgi:hypothetical protein